MNALVVVIGDHQHYIHDQNHSRSLRIRVSRIPRLEARPAVRNAVHVRGRGREERGRGREVRGREQIVFRTASGRKQYHVADSALFRCLRAHRLETRHPRQRGGEHGDDGGEGGGSHHHLPFRFPGSRRRRRPALLYHNGDGRMRLDAARRRPGRMPGTGAALNRAGSARTMRRHAGAAALRNQPRIASRGASTAARAPAPPTVAPPLPLENVRPTGTEHPRDETAGPGRRRRSGPGLTRTTRPATLPRTRARSAGGPAGPRSASTRRTRAGPSTRARRADMPGESAAAESVP